MSVCGSASIERSDGDCPLSLWERAGVRGVTVSGSNEGLSAPRIMPEV
jgi:hypothetical protein